ncbi:MAG: hypothetical protein WBE13_19610 [Candidatus Acidiferrum sp.]
MAKVSRSKRVRHVQKVKRAGKPRSTNGRTRLAEQFFATCTLEELAEAQGVTPMKNPEEMAGAWPEAEDVDQFVKETYESRG